MASDFRGGVDERAFAYCSLEPLVSFHAVRLLQPFFHSPLSAMSSLSAFASLIADSESVRHPQRSAAEVAATVDASMHVMRQRMQHARSQVDADNRFKAANKRREERARRVPAWLVEVRTQHQATVAAAPAAAAPAPAQPWSAEEEGQLLRLLGDPALCKCRGNERPNKRAKTDIGGRSSAHLCCCFTRLVAVSKALQRPLATVQQRLAASSMTVSKPPACFERTSSVAASPHSPPAVRSPDAIADEWSRFVYDPLLLATPATLEWSLGLGRVLAVPPSDVAIAQQWNRARTIELVQRVREQRERIRVQREQQQAAEAGSTDAADPAQLPSASVLDLQLHHWVAVGASLNPPAHAESARMAFEAYLDRGGAAKPEHIPLPVQSQDGDATAVQIAAPIKETEAAHAPFYFPSPRSRYVREERRIFGAASAAADEDVDAHGTAEDDEDHSSEQSGSRPDEEARSHTDDEGEKDGREAAGSDDDSLVAAAAAPSQEEVLRAVRRLSKRYRA